MMLSQMLLDAVNDSVREQPESVPVVHMEQVTSCVVKAIREAKVMEKIEVFLKDLPLIAVKDDDRGVYDRFDGDAIPGTWRTRDIPTSAFTWTSKQVEAADEQEAEDSVENLGPPREKGYQYVSALPGIAELSNFEVFISANASPGLVDNETLRTTIDALEEKVKETFVVLGVTFPMDPTFFFFLFMLTSFCIFVGLDVTADLELKLLIKTERGKWGLGFGSLACACNCWFLYMETLKLRAMDSAMDYFGGGFWTNLPPIAHSLAVTSFILLLCDAGSTAVRGVASIALVLFWFNNLNYLRAIRKLSSLVSMLVEIMKDMAYFSIVMAILILSFSAGFFCLHGKLHILDTVDGSFASNVFRELGDTVTHTFLMSVLCSFDVTELSNPLEPSHNGALSNISFVFFFLLVMLVSVVGMNALIAIMGNTFAQVTDREQAVQYKMIATVLVERLRLGSPEDQRAFSMRNRWIHVLSPSENGSMPVASMFGKGAGNPVQGLKRDLKESTNRTSEQLTKLEEVIRAQGGGGGISEEEMDELNLSLNGLAEQTNAVQSDVETLQEELRKQKKEVEASRKRVDELYQLQQKIPSWAVEMQAQVKDLQDRPPPDVAAMQAASGTGAATPSWVGGMQARLSALERIETIVRDQRIPEWARALEGRMRQVDERQETMREHQAWVRHRLEGLLTHSQTASM